MVAVGTTIGKRTRPRTTIVGKVQVAEGTWVAVQMNVTGIMACRVRGVRSTQGDLGAVLHARGCFRTQGKVENVHRRSTRVMISDEQACNATLFAGHVITSTKDEECETALFASPTLPGPT